MAATSQSDSKASSDRAPGSRAIWEPAEIPPEAEALHEAGHPRTMAALLARRGVTDAAAAEAFLQPRPEHLHDPFLLNGMEAAVERLLEAAAAGERVAVVGDYDVDGVTATALLLAVFRACGLDAEAILPHRLKEGYGFQPVHVEKAVAKGCRVVVTADCGTTSVAAVEAALEAGLSVVVTDHHLPGPALPEAAVQINPKLEGSGYPFSDLCGAGLGLKLALALASRAGRKVELQALLRIACLGTIADMVPLVGENRAIASLGLAAMAALRSPGLLALIREAGVSRPVSAVDVGFRIGPRLNAAGRLGSAEAALELLLTRDRRRSGELARQLDAWNRERQDEEQRAVEEAREDVLGRAASPEGLPGIIVAWSESWHQGVVGIAAGRLARDLNRPTVLLAVRDGQAVGSGRSIRGIDLHGFLSPWRARLLRFGGHRMALGLAAEPRELEALRGEWEEAAAAWPPELLERRYRYELALDPAEITHELLESFEALAPHGEGNPRPLLKVGPMKRVGPPRQFGKGHLNAEARGEAGGSVRLLGWGWQAREAELSGSFEVLATLERDQYRQAPVLKLIDCRPTA